MTGETVDKHVLDELKSVRALLILIASKNGATSDEIGKTLGVTGGYIRNVLSGGGRPVICK